MNDTDEFIEYVNNFLKRPIFPKQEAAIICAMIDGTLNKNGAKEVYKWIIERNLKRHDEIMAMSLEEILEEYDKLVDISK